MNTVDRLKDVPRIGIDIAADLADKYAGVFRMENADTNLLPPEHVLRATKEAVGEDCYNSWLPFTGIRDLRVAVAERYQLDDGLSYDPDTEVVITAGTQEAMLCALLATINPGDGVILVDPTYSGMINRTRLAGGIPQFVPLHEEQGWRLNLDELEKRVTDKTRMIFINVSNMPTGSIFTREEIEAIATLAKKHDLWVLYNAASDKIVFDGLKNYNIASLPHMRQRTIIAGGVSKSYNMVGWRIGWAVADREIMEDIAKVHMYNATITNGPAQAGAIAALRGPQDYIDKCVTVLQRRRDVLVEGLNKIEGLSCVKPTGGWWLLADVRRFDEDASKFAQFLFEKANVAVTPMTDWGDVCSRGHVRFIFSNESEERIREAVKGIAEAVGKYY